MVVSYAHPDVLRRIRLCNRKRAYKTEERGWEICKKVWRKHGDLLWTFRCGECALWHTGHPKDPRLQQMLREASQTW